MGIAFMKIKPFVDSDKQDGGSLEFMCCFRMT